MLVACSGSKRKNNPPFPTQVIYEIRKLSEDE